MFLHLLHNNSVRSSNFCITTVCSSYFCITTLCVPPSQLRVREKGKGKRGRLEKVSNLSPVSSGPELKAIVILGRATASNLVNDCSGGSLDTDEGASHPHRARKFRERGKRRRRVRGSQKSLFMAILNEQSRQRQLLFKTREFLNR